MKQIATLIFALSLLVKGDFLFAQSQGKLLLEEKLETTLTKDGTTYTQPETFPLKDKVPGGSIIGKFEMIDGKVGKALRLHGMSQVRYPQGAGLVDFAGGELSFWVALNFDPAEKNERTRTVLRNQMFVTFMGPGRSKVSVYTCLADLSVCVQNEDGNLLTARNVPFVWRPNEWHHLALRWGNELQLWCDGEKKISAQWDGLFGSIPVKPEGLYTIVGSLIGWGDVESEFAMDELTIRGPGAGQISSRPRIALPLLLDAPTMDGKLTDPFWQKAAKVSGFTGFDKKDLTATQPMVYAGYTAKGLYFGLDAKLAEGRSPRAMLTERDAPIYSGEDAIEIFLKPPLPDNAYCQFIASAAGTRFDSRAKEGLLDANIGGYNPDWEVKTDGRPGQWTAEIFVPFSSLGVNDTPQPGDVWKANFCLDNPAGFSSAVTWSFTGGNFNQSVYFGEMIFTGKERSLRHEKFGGFDLGEPLIAMKLIGEFQPIVTVRSEILDSTGKSVFKYEYPLRDANSTEIKPPPLTTGHYAMTVSATDEKGQSLFYQNLSFQTAKALSLTVANYPYAGYLQITADTRGLKEPMSKVVCAITSADKNQVGVVELKEFKGGIGEDRFTNDKLAPGSYEVEAKALGADNKVLETAKQTLKIFPKPSWWKNDLGMEHSVPLPFLAVKNTGEALSVWGRDYVFSKCAFPRQIVSQKKPMFSQSPTLNLKVNGKSTDLSKVQGTKGDSSPDAISLVGKQAVGDLAVAWESTVEFDGFTRYDLTLTPSKPTKIDELTLTIPLQKDLVRFLLASSGASGNVLAFAKQFDSGFMPYLWLGNDNMGLAFYSEKDQYWTPKDKKMVQVIPGDKETLLKANFIAQPCTIGKPIAFSFGLMATPIRPIPKNDPYAYPSWDHKGSIQFPEFLTYSLAENSIPKEGTLEFQCKLSQPKPGSNTEVFHWLIGKKTVGCYRMTPGEPDVLTLITDGRRILSAKVNVGAEAFTHIALTWDASNMAFYCNGKLASKAESKPLLEALAPGPGKLRFGCNNDWQGYTGLVLDEVRLSRGVRYQGESVAVPAVAFVKDDDTLLLDHLDGKFKPDGEDAKTDGGGVPTIGCSFIAGKFGQGLKMEVAPARPALDVMQEVGVNVTSHWLWQEPMRVYYAQPVLFGETVPGLKEEAADYHKHGIKSVPYAAYPAVGGPSPLVDQFSDEWGIRPVSTLPWQFPGAPEGYHLYNCCVNAKGFADYLVGGAAWAMDSFGFDGIYTDGLTHVYACQNQAHGCGYVDDDGNLHSTWPMFATREAVKRMYRVIKQRHPDGFLVNHASFDYILPTLSFSDILYTGEHEDYENLLTARVRFNSSPWGLYVTTLGGSEHIYSSLHTMTSLLHGVSIWGSGLLGRNDFGRKEYRIRQAYKSFNTSTSEWVPYWTGEGSYYQVDDPKIKVSLYCHTGKDVLMVVANYNREEKEVKLSLELAQMGLQGKVLKAANMMTEESVPVTQGSPLTLRIPAKSFMLMKFAVR